MRPRDSLFSLALKKHIPILCTYELTRRCNLNCVHCYLSDKTTKPLSKTVIKSSLRQLAEMGTLYLVFTGGEIFLRRDLYELIKYARTLKFDLRLFTNGTLIDRKAASRLSTMGLSGVEISLYGREKTHDAVTRQKGAFQKTLNAIRLLKSFRVAVSIKSPAMAINYADLPWLYEFARSEKIPFTLDDTICAKDNGNKNNLKYRVSSRQLKTLLARNKPSLNKSFKNSGISSDDSLFCGAGKSLLGISSDGSVYPCLGWPEEIGDITRQNLKDIWRGKKLSVIRALKNKDAARCNTCEFSIYCRRCPGMAKTEEGSCLLPSSIACYTAKLTKKLLVT